MRILHIGDFHFKSTKNSQFDQTRLVEKLVNSIKNKDAIDLICFTGDLVNSGAEPDDFKKASALLLDKLCQELNVTKSNCILCQGNHDINRNDTSEAVTSFFDNCKSNEDLDSIYDANGKDYQSSILPSKNYFDFLSEWNKSEGKDIINALYTVHHRIVDDRNVAVVTINTSWLSSGLRDDIGKLQFPLSAMKQAVNEVKGAHVKILLLHHPLENLKEANYIELQNIIHSEFDIMLSGHTHREQISTKFAGSNGIFWNTTQASLTYDSTGEIGYSIINYDPNDNASILINRGSFYKKESCFIDLDNAIVSIPQGEEKAKQNKIRQKVTDRYIQEIQGANQLLLNIDDTDDHSFITLFTPPLIVKNNQVEASEKESFISYIDLFDGEGNYVIFGKDKCGKTSLLKRIQLHLLKDYFVRGVIPLYIDYKSYEYHTDLDIQKIITIHYEVNNQVSKNIISQGNLVLLIDNLNENAVFHDQILKFLEDNKKIKFIACSDNIASRIYGEVVDNLHYEKLFFKDLTRKEIRLYTDKQKNIRSSDKEEVIEKITKLCREVQLPVNYWTISLILLIYKKSNNDYSKNLFSILDLCVDEILNKKRLTLTKNALKFEQYKELCSQIAHYLLINHTEYIYGAKYDELVNFISSYIDRNPRVTAEVKDILDYLLETGILKKREDGRFTFRLNGIFEYFLAFYIKENPSFKKDILEKDPIYLSFNNELEIYSGFNRKDEEFLSLIFSKTKNIFDSIIADKIGDENIDKRLHSKVGEANEFAEKIRSLKVRGALSHETQDVIKDNIEPISTDSDVHLKTTHDTEKLNYETLGKYINILSRVYKNSDSIENIELVDQIFDYIIESYIALGIVLIDEVKSVAKKENLKDTNKDEEHIIGEEMIMLVSQFIPLLTQVDIYEAIGHPNMQRIIKSKIQSLLKDAKNRQYQLFILYFLLLDTDIKSNKEIIEDVFKHINLPVLKVSSFFKLNYYLAFKGYNNKELEQHLKNQVQKARLRLDSKTDAKSLQKGLSNRTHQNIVRSEKEKL